MFRPFLIATSSMAGTSKATSLSFQQCTILGKLNFYASDLKGKVVIGEGLFFKELINFNAADGISELSDLSNEVSIKHSAKLKKVIRPIHLFSNRSGRIIDRKLEFINPDLSDENLLANIHTNKKAAKILLLLRN